MTTFEILTIVFYAVVVMIGYLICRGIATVIDNQQETDSNLRKMDAGLDDRIANIQQQLEDINKILQHGFTVTGRPNGGSSIEPYYKR